MSDPDGAPQSSSPRVPQLVVGIGASAGGIRALRDLFSQVEPGHAFSYVVVLHLSPSHDSRLAEVLQACTALPVVQVTDRTRLQPSHVYVISPDGSLQIEGADLVMKHAGGPEQRRAPVDLFFRTLAEAHREAAVAIVLSGTGADGASGIKRVKEHGGLVIAQDPEGAEFRDMPANAIATGVVDLVLPVHQIPARLADYAARLTTHQPAAEGVPKDSFDSGAMREVMNTLRLRTGHDFSNYKLPTLLRRMSRRMALHRLGTLPDYAEVLRANPDEAAALMRELLISVTNFFRDREAFAALQQHVLPQLLSAKRDEDQLRIWVAGCATGEEAYSLAILFAEAAGTDGATPPLQVFATDLDERAIAHAREGLYSHADVVDVTPERISRYFHREAGGYRVRRELRELVLFARHNLIKDPPFSHLDLIACRNVLIYLNRPVQERLIETFHFALRHGGFLFLGRSESADSRQQLFVPVAQTDRVYQSRSALSRRALPPPPQIVPFMHAGGRVIEEPAQQQRYAPAELHRRLLEQYAPPSMVVTQDFRVVHLSDGAGRYLQVAGGEPSRDVLTLVHPDLRADLRGALHQAARQRTVVSVERLPFSPRGAGATVSLIVRPALRDSEDLTGFFLVLFEEHADTPDSDPVQLVRTKDPGVGYLEEEVARVKADLRATVEQYETQVEEVRAGNEELQAMNEELRSAAEELETSREELQSVNEELTTVNQELKIKIDELSLTNNDLQNFINSTDIGTIFLDRQLRVKLSTPRAREVFSLLPSDSGRKLSDITSQLVYDRLQDDIRHVLSRLHSVEHEVQAHDGRWYLLRVVPYRTLDDRIDGVVIIFPEITVRRQAEQQVRASEERLRLLIDSAFDYAIFTLDPHGLVDSWNAGAERMFGYSASQIIGRSSELLFTAEDRAAGAPVEELRRAREVGRAEDERWHVRQDGTRLYCSGVTTPLGERGSLGFAKIARDLTAQRRAQVQLEDAHQQLEDRVRQRTTELEAEVADRAAAQEQIMNLVRRLVTAQEDERARVARDLHDQLGQQLTALRLTLQRTRDSTVDGGAAAEDLERALTLAAAVDREVDFLAWELRPAALDDLGLAAALPRYVREWSAHYGIPAEVRLIGARAMPIGRDVEVMLYRIAQEGLNNIAKHAHASRVDIILETRDGAIVLVIEDDGVGFEANERETRERGFGLLSMAERAALVGATLQIESAVGEGTTLFVRCANEPGADVGHQP